MQFLYFLCNMFIYNIVSNISCRFLCKVKMQYFPIFLLVFLYMGRSPNYGRNSNILIPIGAFGYDL